MSWLKEAWDNLSDNTIRRCFVKSNCLSKDTLAKLNSQVLRRTQHSCDNDDDVDDLADVLQQVRLQGNLSTALGLTSMRFFNSTASH